MITLKIKSPLSAREEAAQRIAQEEQDRELREWLCELQGHKALAPCTDDMGEERFIIPYEVVWREKVPSEEDSNAVKAVGEDMHSRSIAARDLSGHRRRVLDRFARTGLSGFSDHEILELLLFYTIPRRDTKQTGRVMMERFGSVWEALGADTEALASIPFVTERTARLFHLIRELSRLGVPGRTDGSCDSPSKLKSLLAPIIIRQETGRFYAVCFDISLRLTDIYNIPYFPDGASMAELRRVAARMSGIGGAVAAVEYRPGYKGITSRDMELSQTLRRLLSGMDIEYIGCLIYDGGEFHSVPDK